MSSLQAFWVRPVSLGFLKGLFFCSLYSSCFIGNTDISVPLKQVIVLFILTFSKTTLKAFDGNVNNKELDSIPPVLLAVVKLVVVTNTASCLLTV